MLDSPAEAVQQQRTAHHQSPPTKVLADRRILLAEDGIDNQNLVRHLLHKAGAEIEIAENGVVENDVAACLEAEGGAAVIEQVELDVATTLDKLFLAVGFAPRRFHVAADEVAVDIFEA